VLDRGKTTFHVLVLPAAHATATLRRFHEAQPLAIDISQRDDTGRIGGDPVPMSLEMLSTTTLPRLA
jgi:hypothetical protein